MILRSRGNVGLAGRCTRSYVCAPEGRGPRGAAIMSTLSREFLDLQVSLAGEYSVERELGRGGMGVVLLARDVLLDRLVAIKVLAPHLTADPVARERFVREARTAAGLSHPNIVPIHRVGEGAGLVYFVMSYVPGQTLAERIRARGPLVPADAVRLVREVAWALAYAHGRGIVHRDVKPDNILIEEGTGRAMVMDFGIARVGGTTLSSDAGGIIGTAQFMSPEQAMNEPVDGRSDLYALGVVAYVAVSGRLPFAANSIPALLMQQVSAAAPPISDAAPGTPAPLASAIHRCLEKEPSKRFASGEELADAIAPAETRPALPAPLRAWLAERNPATVFYAVWSGILGIPFLFDLAQFLNYQRSIYLVDMLQLALMAAAPLIPVIGFHARRAGRLFKSGYTLDDLRSALDVEARERNEADKLDPEPRLSALQKLVRAGMYASFVGAGTLLFLGDAVRFALEMRHISLDFNLYRGITVTGWITWFVLLIVMNVDQIPLLPASARNLLKRGLRERLWHSRLGTWLANRLGAPKTSRSAVGTFQPTEVALGGAVDELFDALPSSYRDSLKDLPSVVRALGQRARHARAELESIDRSGGHAVEPGTRDRRAAVESELGRSVAALESIRVELLRLHAAGAGANLTSLTTLVEDARAIGDQLARLSAAQREIREVLSPGEEPRIPTPA